MTITRFPPREMGKKKKRPGSAQGGPNAKTSKSWWRWGGFGARGRGRLGVVGEFGVFLRSCKSGGITSGRLSSEKNCLAKPLSTVFLNQD